MEERTIAATEAGGLDFNLAFTRCRGPTRALLDAKVLWTMEDDSRLTRNSRRHWGERLESWRVWGGGDGGKRRRRARRGFYRRAVVVGRETSCRREKRDGFAYSFSGLANRESSGCSVRYREQATPINQLSSPIPGRRISRCFPAINASTVVGPAERAVHRAATSSSPGERAGPSVPSQLPNQEVS